MNEQADAAPEFVPVTVPRRVGKYEIQRPLARGAMGVVYLARDTVLHRSVAVKVMASSIAGDPDLKARFEREARVAAQLTHPNVVTMYELGYHVDGSPYIAMELLKGADLQRVLEQGPPLGLNRKISIVVQVLDGLTHAHKAGIIHRDIKPANIFIKADGIVKILDFGVARLVQASHSTSGIVGTADYMSPEQVRGALVDGRSDVFSCGCVLFEMITGRGPFRSDNIANTVYKITHNEPDFSLVPEDPEHARILPILKRSLDKDVERRYQSCDEFAADLVQLAAFRGTATTGRRLIEDLLPLELPPSSLTPLGDGHREPVIVRLESGSTVDLRVSSAEGGTVPRRDRTRGRPSVLTLPPGDWRRAALHGGALALVGLLVLGVHVYISQPAADALGPRPAAVIAGGADRGASAPPATPLPAPAPSARPSAAPAPSTTGAPSPHPAPRAALDLPRATDRAPALPSRVAPAATRSAAPTRSAWKVPPGLRAEAGPRVVAPSAPPAMPHPAPTPEPSPPAGAPQVAGVARSTGLSVAARADPDLPPPRRAEVLRRFEGYLTDESCGLKGGQADHWECVQRCLRKGHKPMFVMDGKLYRLEGLERIGGDRNRAVDFYGYLDPETSTIRVAGGK